MIIDIYFAKASGDRPSGEDLYKEAIKANPSWDSYIKSVIKQMINHPVLGVKSSYLPDDLSDEDKNKYKDLNFETLSKDKSYKDVKAKSFRITESDSRGGSDANRSRFVYLIENIPTYAKYVKHIIHNDKNSFIKLDNSHLHNKESLATFNSKKYHYLVIIEVGGHYKYKNSPVRYNKASSTDQLWTPDLDEAFSEENLLP